MQRQFHKMDSYLPTPIILTPTAVSKMVGFSAPVFSTPSGAALGAEPRKPGGL